MTGLRSRALHTRRLTLHLASCALCLAALSSCGRKSAVRPPQDVKPKVISNLAAMNTVDGIQLSWSRPGNYANNQPMTDLAGFIIERAAGTDPLAPFQRVDVLEVNDRDRFRQIKRFTYVDPDTNVGTPYRYRVVSFTLDRYFSAPSNEVTVERTTTGEESHAPLPTPQR